MKRSTFFHLFCAFILIFIFVSMVIPSKQSENTHKSTCETLLEQRSEIRYADLSDQKSLIESNERLFLKCGCDTIKNK